MTVEQRLAIQLGNNAANAAMTVARLETELEELRAEVSALKAEKETKANEKT